MKWAGMYLVGFLVLIGGLLAALWKVGILASIGTTWTVIGVAIAVLVLCFQYPIAAAKKTSRSTEVERIMHGSWLHCDH